jgi:hypothetical protein
VESEHWAALFSLGAAADDDDDDDDALDDVSPLSAARRRAEAGDGGGGGGEEEEEEEEEEKAVAAAATREARARARAQVAALSRRLQREGPAALRPWADEHFDQHWRSLSGGGGGGGGGGGPAPNVTGSAAAAAGGAHALVSSMTALVSEALAEWLGSLAEPVVPASMRGAALAAAAAGDVERLLALPPRLPRAHAGTFHELLALAGRALNALAQLHCPAAAAAAAAAAQQPDAAPEPGEPAAAALATAGSGLPMAVATAAAAGFQGEGGEAAASSPELRAQATWRRKLLRRLGWLMLRPVGLSEQQQALGFVSFFLLGSLEPPPYITPLEAQAQAQAALQATRAQAQALDAPLPHSSPPPPPPQSQQPQRRWRRQPRSDSFVRGGRDRRGYVSRNDEEVAATARAAAAAAAPLSQPAGSSATMLPLDLSPR